MWLALPSADSLTRPRIAVAVISAIAAASLGYHLYSSHDSLSGPGLHRSNAVRRPARRSRRASLASEASHAPDENTQHDPDAEDGVPLMEEWWDDADSMPPPARAGYNIVSLLFRVSEDNARRNACVHRGCGCNSCNMIPIRGIRYRCANCADFDLCETCEAQGVHNKTHIFYKIKVPAPPFGPRQMQPVWYSGDPDTCIRNLPRSLINKLSKETGFERPEIEAFWEQFTFMANTEWREDPDGLQLAMDKKTFERCLVPLGRSRHATPNLIHDRMFSFYDTNDDDLIGFAEFLQGLAYRKRKDKLRRIFQGYDMDGDGFVNRRDFLRMFRAYYVLYKHMHRDILDGLDDQLMASTESQQLVGTRQPLSSIFGREGRVPRADAPPRNDGKTYHPNGDVELDSNHVTAVHEDPGDLASRTDILTRLFAPSIASPPTVSWTAQVRSPDSEPDTSYWDALLDPPGALEDLPALLSGTRRQENDIDLDLDAEMTSPEEGGASPARSDAGNDSHPGDDAHEPNGGSSHRLRHPSEYVHNMPTESELRSQIIRHRRQMAPRLDKRRRTAARRALHERWRRRQFYLDEEEGGGQPDGWDEGEDVMKGLNGFAESSKTAMPFPPRSRSSSKVRFAEDMDELEVRSLPSTSSRSVPERWGGFDIPDEERDAGKEILYQITQQAFNELLDAVFKEKEDLAVRAAETKEKRQEHRALLDELDIEMSSDTTEDYEDARAPSNPPSGSKPVVEQNLDELLQASGYTVDQNLVPGATVNGEVEVNGNQAIPEKDQPESDEDPEEQAYQDPTMPQFRPNSDKEGSPSRAKPAPISAKEETPARPKDDTDAQPASKPIIPTYLLVEWKRLNQAEKEAEERGGWGKLSFEEFEVIYRRHENPKPAGNRLDYLGSWVDFCIP